MKMLTPLNTQIRLIGIRNLDTLQEELVSESFLNWDEVSL